MPRLSLSLAVDMPWGATGVGGGLPLVYWSNVVWTWDDLATTGVNPTNWDEFVDL